GWRPARTIVLAAWDGEEWGLLGSTEWAEAHGDELRAKAVAYYNSDTNEKGWIGVAGSHALERFFTELARDVTQPGAPGGGSVLDAWRDVEEIAKLAAKSDTTKGLDLAAVRAAVSRVDTAALAYEAALAKLDGLTAAQVAARRVALAAVNLQLARTEQALADSGGLPRRPWFRHLLYAPGFYTGYGVKTMPGIREAVEQRHPAEAQAESARVAAALDRY